MRLEEKKGVFIENILEEVRTGNYTALVNKNIGGVLKGNSELSPVFYF